MSKIRMNTELRNKLFNKIKNVFENEDTQEREAFLQARENVDCEYDKAQHLARQVVERAYPKEDVATLRHFKNKYGQPCDVVAKDKCFYFAHSEDVDDEGETKETKSHFDFGLFGNLNGSDGAIAEFIYCLPLKLNRASKSRLHLKQWSIANLVVPREVNRISCAPLELLLQRGQLAS